MLALMGNRTGSLEERVRRLKTYLTGWRVFWFWRDLSVLRDLDGWIRHRLRCVQGKQWKVFQRRKADLIRLGVAPALAVPAARRFALLRRGSSHAAKP